MHLLHVFHLGEQINDHTFKRHQELILIAAHDQQAGRSTLLLPTWQQAVQHCSLWRLERARAINALAPTLQLCLQVMVKDCYQRFSQ